jgi:hypothetical protein
MRGRCSKAWKTEPDRSCAAKYERPGIERHRERIHSERLQPQLDRMRRNKPAAPGPRLRAHSASLRACSTPCSNAEDGLRNRMRPEAHWVEPVLLFEEVEGDNIVFLVAVRSLPFQEVLS